MENVSKRETTERKSQTNERRSRGNNATLLSQKIFPVPRKNLRCSFHKATTYLYNAVRHGCDSVSPLKCLCGSNRLQRLMKVREREEAVSRESQLVLRKRNGRAAKNASP